MISDDEREQVRQATDFVSLVGETVVLKPRGADDFWGCCPFHNEKSPSFHVRPSTGLWHCFGCGEGGDVFSYVQKRENLSFPDSIRYLAERSGIELHETGRREGGGPRRNRLMECLEEARDFYHAQLMRGLGPGNDEARAYFACRGFNSPVCQRWGLGFAPGHGALVRHLRSKGFTRQEMLVCDLAVDRNGSLRDRFYDRVTFPILDEAGRAIGMGGRVMGDAKPKYLNSKDSPVWHKSKHLFAYYQAKDAIVAAGQAIVVEGYTDAISLHEAGFKNVVAVLGTALTADHIKLLSRLRPKSIVMMLDGDAAGQRAAEKAVRYVDATEAELLSVVLPDNQDPAEYIAAHGADSLRERIAGARRLVDTVLQRRFDEAATLSPGAQKTQVEQIARILAPLKNSLAIDRYVSAVADYFAADKDQVMAMVRAAVPLAEDERPPRGRGQAVPNDGPSYDEEPPYDDAYDLDAAPQDDMALEYSLNDVYGAPALSGDDRNQRRFERELLSLIAASPEALRPYLDRVATVQWSDEAHQAIAWAMLATPPGTSPAEVVQAATAAVPQAPRILAAGELSAVSSAPVDDKAAFLLDNIELFSAKRRMRQIKAVIGTAEADQIGPLMAEATELQNRVRALQRSNAART